MINLLGFFTVYLLLYGGLHLHLLLKVQSAFHLHGWALMALMAWLLLMFLAPMAVWRLESIGLQALVRPVAFIGFCWMGVLFLFFSIAMALDLALLLLKGGNLLLGGGQGRFAFHPLLLLLAPAVMATVLAAYGYLAARTLYVEPVVVALPQVPAEVGGYRIVQISDLHLGVMTDRRWLDEVIATVNGLQPDLLVATGDIIDSHVDGSQEFAATMRRLQARDGKVAIAGNHEHFAGIERAMAFLHEAGFTTLRDEVSRVRPWLTLVGVDDRHLHSGETPPASPEREQPLLQQVRGAGGVVVLLKHQPRVAADSLGLFDLQLSGHVHQGQIYPFRYLTRLVYPVESGLTSLDKGSWLYLNRGTGTWGPPMRVLAPPEITRIELRHAAQ